MLHHPPADRYPQLGDDPHERAERAASYGNAPVPEAVIHTFEAMPDGRGLCGFTCQGRAQALDHRAALRGDHGQAPVTVALLDPSNEPDLPS
jgi:hypothetical protein